MKIDERKLNEFVEKAVTDLAAGYGGVMTVLGHKLGLYKAMAHAGPLANVLREDVVEPALPVDKVLQNAAESDGSFFKVPKVIGGDEDSAG